ncbi:MAG: exodeoxyribonuclease III [Anaerolineae bacterium]|nr:exodeoxyribonuclease III [Anaerolineae bacterium]
MRLLSWNVNGIRAVQNKGFLEWLQAESPDVLCVQETKAQKNQLDEALLKPDGYHTYWHSAQRKGYSGVATFSKREPISVQEGFGIDEFDAEGRVLMTEYSGFKLFGIYFPNGKRSPERLDYKLRFYETFLHYCDELHAQGDKLIICGDVNTAHQEIDLANPKANASVSGFLPEERAWLDNYFEHGFVDTFRVFHPDEPDRYTWWTYISRARSRNVGWRIDYFWVSESLMPAVKDADILSEVMGSDHCPVMLELDESKL